MFDYFFEMISTGPTRFEKNQSNTKLVITCAMTFCCGDARGMKRMLLIPIVSLQHQHSSSLHVTLPKITIYVRSMSWGEWEIDLCKVLFWCKHRAPGNINMPKNDAKIDRSGGKCKETFFFDQNITLFGGDCGKKNPWDQNPTSSWLKGRSSAEKWTDGAASGVLGVSKNEDSLSFCDSLFFPNPRKIT